MLFESLQQKLALPHASLQLCLLGLLGGIFSACAIILFRLAIEKLQLSFLTEHDNFANTDSITRILMPIGAAAIVISIAKLTGYKHYRLGIPFVIHRVKKHYGVMPFRTTINQVFGGIVALAGGFSVGREGPSTHIGAGTSSWFASWLNLPNNSVRILSGCGIAAGIAASFNTPLAAVIFVMELVFREYKIHIFIPVMLASIAGDVLSRMVLGESNDFTQLVFYYVGLEHIISLTCFGALLGVAAYVFNNTLMGIVKRCRPIGMAKRLMMAGIITAAIGSLLPEAMGTGHTAITAAINSSDNFPFLMLLLVTKVILTVAALGLGIPGGVIGPIFVIGILLGVTFTVPLSMFMDNAEVYTHTYALLGMAGLIAAALNAPMTALVTILELANTTDIILPAMIVIVSSFLFATQVLKNRSLFVMQLIFQKLPYLVSPADEELQRVGVVAKMDRKFELFHDAQEDRIFAFLKNNPTHPVVQRRDYVYHVEYYLVSYDFSLDPHSASPIKYLKMQGVPINSTLAEVYKLLHNKVEGAVFVYDESPEKIKGVVTLDMLREYWSKETV